MISSIRTKGSYAITRFGHTCINRPVKILGISTFSSMSHLWLINDNKGTEIAAL